MMIAAEEGVSIVPEYCINQLRSLDNIIYRPLSGEEETEEIIAVWHRENITPALQHFIEQL
jgi:DNA-binding transcriptional LysR family regulator